MHIGPFLFIYRVNWNKLSFHKSSASLDCHSPICNIRIAIGDPVSRRFTFDSNRAPKRFRSDSGTYHVRPLRRTVTHCMVMASLLPWGSFHAQANYSRRCETTLIRIDQLLINCLLYLPPAGEWIWPCWHFISSLQEMRDNKSYTSKTRNIKSVNRNQFQGLYGGAAFQVRLITYIHVDVKKNVFTFFLFWSRFLRF